MHQCISYMPTLPITNQEPVLQIRNNAMNNVNVVLNVILQIYMWYCLSLTKNISGKTLKLTPTARPPVQCKATINFNSGTFWSGHYILLAIVSVDATMTLHLFETEIE